MLFGTRKYDPESTSARTRKRVWRFLPISMGGLRGPELGELGLEAYEQSMKATVSRTQGFEKGGGAAPLTKFV